MSSPISASYSRTWSVYNNTMLDTCTPELVSFSSIMFLHALLFFLLSPSVFAAPAGSSSHGHDDDNVKSAVGYWYPVEAKENAVSGIQPIFWCISHVSQSPPQVLQIVSATVVYSHQLKEDGSLDESPKATKQIATNQLDDNINIISVLWRRFPTVSRLQYFLPSG
jgi:hypothetical protein